MNYSVIIPHKNTPQLLERCLASIPMRDDLEIIIVDDNSDAEIVDFAHFPGLNRARTRCIFTKEGKGAGYARNIGLKYAVGDWVLFTDADDYFTPAINRIFDKYALVSDFDMVFLNAKVIDENSTITSLIVNRYIDNYFNQRRGAINVLRFGFWAPWSRLIKRSIFIDHEISFEQVKVCNDMQGIINASIVAKSFDVCKDVVYMYYKPSTGSQTKRAYDKDAYVQCLRQQLQLNNIYRKVGYPYYRPIIYAFRNKVYNQSEEVKSILRKYNYSNIRDFLYLVNYGIAKIRKII